MSTSQVQQAQQGQQGQHQHGQQGHGKTIVITGATRGIGRGILEHWAKSSQCDCIVGICKSGSSHFQELNNKFQGNQKVKLFEADVSDFDSLNNVVNELKDHKIDLVLANAGVINKPKPVWEVTKDELDEAYRVDVRGTFNTMKAFLPVMKGNKGAVIANVSSDWGLCGTKGYATYCMSKFAIEGLTKTAALDVENEEVALVSVSPGMVATDFLIEAYGEEQAKKIGVSCEEFVPQFCEKLASIDKSQNGQHLDFAVKKATRAG